MRRVESFALARPFVVSLACTAVFVACGGSAPPPVTPKPAPPASSSVVATPELPPIPVVAPEVDKTPASCDAFLAKPAPKAEDKKAEPKPDDKKDPKKAKTEPGVCSSNATALAALGRAARAIEAGDRAARDEAFAALAGCDRVPVLVLDVVRAQAAPIVCAEAILTPVLEAHGKEALPNHQAAARALVGASRLARLRAKKGAFDLLARAEVDPKAKDSAVQQLTLWKDALEKEERDALTLSKNAPAEIGAIARFEAAAAWIAFAKELRATPYPTELASLAKKDKDLEVHYYAKLDEVTMPILERARALALAGIGGAVRDGVLVKDLPSFQQIVEPFKSRAGFEHRATRDLELLPPDPLADKKVGDAVRFARFLPPWAAYATLERAEPAALLTTPVLTAFAVHRGIPAALRLEIEKDKKLDDQHRGAIALSRLRVALAYGSRPDAESLATWKAKQPVDLLRVAIASALLGPKKDDGKAALSIGYDLAGLDALSKKPVIGAAAQYDAALLALENAQLFTGAPPDPMQPPIDPKKAYADAVARLEAVSQRKDLDDARKATAKTLAASARASLDLLDKKP